MHPPDVSISQDPPSGDNTPLLAGTQLTLTCTIVLRERLSDEITVEAKWLRHGRDISPSHLTARDGTTYVLEHTFPSLSANDSTTYTCEASLTSPYAGVLATTSKSTSVLSTAQISNGTHTRNKCIYNYGVLVCGAL